MTKKAERSLADFPRYVEAKQKYGRVIAGMKGAEAEKAAAERDRSQHTPQAEYAAAAVAFLDGADDVSTIDTVQSFDERIAAAERQHGICKAAKPAATRELRKAENEARAELTKEYGPQLADKRAQVQAVAKQLLAALDDERNAWQVARKAGAVSEHMPKAKWQLAHSLKQLIK